MSLMTAGSPLLLLANRKDIRLADATSRSRNMTSLVADLDAATAVDFYYDEQYICWTEMRDEKIQCGHINGSSLARKPVVTSGLQSPDGLACDWLGKKLYWIDSETKRMEVSDLDGRYRKVLYWQHMDQPRAVAVNPLSGYLYWTDWGEDPKIERASMDGNGTSRSSIVTTDIHWPNGLSIDYVEQRLYWVDAKLGYIHSSDLDGSARRAVIASGLPHPFGVSVFDGRVYWTDWRNKSLLSCNKLGRDVKVVLAGLYSPMDVRVYAKERQPAAVGINQCAIGNGNCSHLCLMAPNSRGFSCSCPTGIRLLADGRTCASGANDIVFLARRQDLRMISLDTPDYTDVVIEVSNVRHAIAIDYDPVDQFVYWTDDEVRAIQRARLNGSEQSVIVGTEVLNPDGVAVDWLARNLFWTDTGTDRIEVARLNGTSRRVIISDNLDEPRAIALHPIKGYLYWTDWGKQARIERAAMDGSERVILVNSSIVWPNGIALDLQLGHMYWADAKLDKIEMADLDGSRRRELFSSSSNTMPHAFGFSVLGDYVYWSDWQQRTIERIHKLTGSGRQTIVEQLPDLMGIRAINTNTSTLGSSACSGNKAGCSHLCLSRPSGGPVCACPMGMELMADNRTCVVPEAFLLFSEQRDIKRVSLETSNRDTTIPLAAGSLRSLSALDVHVGQQKIVFADKEQKVVNRSFLNGSHSETIVEFGLLKPVSMAVDWLSDNLYIIDDTRIEAIRLNTTARRVLIWQELETPQSIAVYPEMGYMYWSDWVSNQPPRIDMARLDGSDRRPLATGSGLGRATSLTIDFATRRLYWVDIDKARVAFCTLLLPSQALGSDMPPALTLVQTCSRPQFPLESSGSSKPHVITIYGDFMYWYDMDSRHIERVNKTSLLDRSVVVAGDVSAVVSLLVFHSSRQPGYSACRNNNGGCEHFCFTSVENPLHFCACPTHFTINADNKTCSAPAEFLLVSQRQQVSRITDPVKEPDVVLPIRALRNVTAVSYDPVNQMLYWLDARAKVIGRSYTNGTGAEILVLGTAGVSPYDFAIDPYSRLLYWSDDACNCINVTRLDRTPVGVVVGSGSGREGLAAGKLRPAALVLRPDKGYMFFVNRSSTTGGRVIRASMDGTNMLIIVNNTSSVATIAVDSEVERLYWSDADQRMISSCDFSGADVKTLVTNVEAASMTVYGDYLYYVDGSKKQTGTVARVDKTSGRFNASVRARVGGLTDIHGVKLADSPESRSHPCKKNRGGCSHICLILPPQPDGLVTSLCSCPAGLALGLDRRTCEEPPTCKATEFACTSGSVSCIPLTWRCDAAKECSDGSDEVGCPTRCAADGSQFMCDSGECIERSGYCDGVATCNDASDEPQGGKCCTTRQFTCGDLQCIDNGRLCDGAKDCADGTDESKCSLDGTGGPGDKLPTKEQYTVGVVIVMCIVGISVLLIVVFVLYKCRKDPRLTEAGLVLRPLHSVSENGDIPLSSLLHGKSVTATTVLSGSTVSATMYDRNHITGASSSSSSAVTHYPAGPNPPPSPVTERSLCLHEDICSSTLPSGVTSLRSYRHYRGTRGMPAPPTTPCSTDVCDESEPSVIYHKTTKTRTRSRKKYRPLMYNVGSFPPPPTPARSQVYSMDEASECPPSPSTVRSFRSNATTNPYPPPPSPDCASD